ncbi:MAG: 50S ribosomal protein L6, partial [Deltaproteobacteria bacterium]
PDGVSVDVSGKTVTVKGKLGTLTREIPDEVTVAVEDGKVVVKKKVETSKRCKAFQGLVRSLINNMVIGVSQGFEKVLEIHGVGYRAEVKGKELHLTLGYSHPVIFPIPDDIKIAVEERNTVIKVSGIDKEKVGLVAAKIRSFRKPDVYKNKGIRYRGERLIKKAGKAVGK